MSSEPGLRERKKQRTRQRHRGDRAPALRRARASTPSRWRRSPARPSVSGGTVFNYFPTKEDLFYGQMEDFEADARRRRARRAPPGESVLDAFRRFVLDGTKRARPTRSVADVITTGGRIVVGEPRAAAREREIVDALHARARRAARRGERERRRRRRAARRRARADGRPPRARRRRARDRARGRERRDWPGSRDRGRACVRGARARARRVRRQEPAAPVVRHPERFSRSRRRISHIRTGPAEA